MVDMLKTAQDVAASSTSPAVEVRLNLAAFSIDAFKETIYAGIQSISDDEMTNLVGASYNMVINHIIHSKDSALATFLFSSTKYLMALLTVLSMDKHVIDPSVSTNLNKIIYDYFQLGTPDSVVEQLLYSIVNTIDRDTVTALIVAGVNNDDAVRLTLCYHSAGGNYNLAISRINKHLIYNYDRDTLNVQKIADIYLVFFADKFTVAFIGAMIDTNPAELQKMDDDESEIYSMISNAVLGILEYMPMNAIANIIAKYSKDYYSYYKAMNPALEPRFKLTSLSGDYPSVNQVVNDILKCTILVP